MLGPFASTVGAIAVAAVECKEVSSEEAEVESCILQLVSVAIAQLVSLACIFSRCLLSVLESKQSNSAREYRQL